MTTQNPQNPQKPTLQQNPPTTKRKAPATPETKTIHFTARDSPWTYLELQLIHQPDTSQSIKSYPLDPLTARTHLTSALSQFMGLSGTAIPIDILKISSSSSPSQSACPSTESSGDSSDGDKTVWIRVPRQDSAGVVAALSSWIGGTNKAGSVAWRVCGKGNYLGALVNGDGGDLFVP